jgi:phosphatidylserine/phosphatidylglycerophosphate/cardiolipin synthase-like enzyme
VRGDEAGGERLPLAERRRPLEQARRYEREDLAHEAEVGERVHAHQEEVVALREHVLMHLLRPLRGYEQVKPELAVAAPQAIREQIDGARRRLDVMNPYVTDADMISRIVAAAKRGVAVRLVVSQTSNNAQATAALKHYYGELAEAGVELWELPGTVVHAKVVVADDVVSFGTVNLDAWALYRNSEIMMIARSPEAAALLNERLFEPDIARSKRGEPPSGTRDRLQSWLCDKLTYYL